MDQPHRQATGLCSPVSEPDLVLASGSPRRHAILTDAGVPHRVVPPDVDERELAGETPAAMAIRLAREKAVAVAASLEGRPERLVLGADTIVVIGDEVLGKPLDAAHARRMLARLTGRQHEVVTGVALVHAATGRHWCAVVSSRVRMRAASAAEIDAYVATGEPLDKAGSYAVQGEGGRRFVERVEGSESNVIGLPLEETLALIRQARSDLAATVAVRVAEAPGR